MNGEAYKKLGKAGAGAGQHEMMSSRFLGSSFRSDVESSNHDTNDVLISNI